MPSAWQQHAGGITPPVIVRGGTKYRSSSVNSNSSFESFYSGLGNHLDTDQELSSLDSAGLNSLQNHLTGQHNSKLHSLGYQNVTPPVKREQPSPFQPIYSGFGSTFGFEDRQVSRGGNGSNQEVLEDLENKFEPLTHSNQITFDQPPSQQTTNTINATHANGGPFDLGELNALPRATESGRHTSEPRLGHPAQQPPVQVLGTPQSLPAPSPPGELEETDKKKKRKKKKKKAKSTNDETDLDATKGETQEAMRCFNCDQLGHLSRDCTQPRACFLCGETTHVAKQCKFSALAQPGSGVDGGDVEGEKDGDVLLFPALSPSPVQHAGSTRGASPAVMSCNGKATPVSECTGETQAEDISSDKKKNICLNCGEPGHRLKNCPYGRKCFQCGQVGHVARECPSISEALKLMQKKRIDESPSPEHALLLSEEAPARAGSVNLSMDDANTSTSSVQYPLMSSSGNGDSFFSSINAPGTSGSTSAVASNRFHAGSPFAAIAQSAGSSVSSMSPRLRPDTASPPLLFGGGAFSSFGGMGIDSTAAESGRSSALLEPEQEDSDPSGDMNDPHLQDFVAHLVDDLDINDSN